MNLKNQTFDHDQWRVNVLDLVNFIKEIKLKSKMIELKTLLPKINNTDFGKCWNWQGEVIRHIRRISRANLNYPIVTFKDKENKLHVLDGYHRIFRCIYENIKTIKTYELDQNQFNQLCQKFGKEIDFEGGD